MRIALYYPWVYLKSGVERVILETVKRGKHDCTIFTNHFDRKNTYPEFKNLKVIELKRIPVRRNLFDVLQAALVILFQKIDLTGFDLLLVHSEGLGDLILFRNNKIPAVCYCHTPLRPVFDTDYKMRIFKKRNTFRRVVYFIFAFIFKNVDIYLWQKYKYVFFNSNESVKRARNGGLLKNLKGKYEILRPGLDVGKTNPSWIYRPYFFLPGRIMWTKNIELGIRSFIKFKKLSKNFKKFKLIIAGHVDEKSISYFKELKNLTGGRKDIKFVISPSDVKMKNLYSNCWAVLLTAFNEDFGITLLEGNSYGKPAIAINRGGPKESQVSGVTGYLVDDNINAFTQKLMKLGSNPSLVRKLGRYARENSKRYDWGNFLDKLDGVMEKMVT